MVPLRWARPPLRDTSWRLLGGPDPPRGFILSQCSSRIWLCCSLYRCLCCSVPPAEIERSPSALGAAGTQLSLPGGVRPRRLVTLIVRHLLVLAAFRATSPVSRRPLLVDRSRSTAACRRRAALKARCNTIAGRRRHAALTARYNSLPPPLATTALVRALGALGVREATTFSGRPPPLPFGGVGQGPSS